MSEHQKVKNLPRGPYDEEEINKLFQKSQTSEFTLQIGRAGVQLVHKSIRPL